MMVEERLRLHDVRPFDEPGAPPSVVFRGRIELRQVEGDRSHRELARTRPPFHCTRFAATSLGTTTVDAHADQLQSANAFVQHSVFLVHLQYTSEGPFGQVRGINPCGDSFTRSRLSDVPRASDSIDRSSCKFSTEAATRSAKPAFRMKRRLQDSRRFI